jgi:hypothetical protein
MVKKSIFTFILITSLATIHSCKTIAADVGCNGKYSAANINLLDAILLNRKYGGDFTRQLEMFLDLKKDSTFQIEFCQQKIVFDGKWKTDGDYVLLYDVYNHYLSRPDESFRLFREPKKKLIFFPNKTQKTINNRDSIIITYTVLEMK